MLTWLLAAVAGMAIAVVAYGWRDPRRIPERALPAALRAGALTALIAALLDAPAGPSRAPRPLVALDISESWLQGSDSAAWATAIARARALGGDSVLVFGDSVRPVAGGQRPIDRASRVRPVIARAQAAGRPVVIVTDGRADDPETLNRLPAGSRLEIISPVPRTDLAVTGLDLPRSHTRGDTLEARVTITAGGSGAPPGRVVLTADDAPIAEATVDSLPAFSDRSILLRGPVARGDGQTIIRALVTAAGDREPRNDTLVAIIEVSEAAGAVFVSTSPDLDARYAVAVLRGTLSLPTRGFFRVAPGQWRVEGTLTSVSEADVRRAARAAPLLVLHGDTTVFGAPLSATSGALALMPPVSERGDWYAIGAPPSPLAAGLSGVRWDSLPPVDVAPRLPRGAWEALETRRARQFERRPAIVGLEQPRRTVIIGASGLWRWRFRAGASAEAYAALWGSIFDWLLMDRSSPRAVSVAEPVLRAGDRIRWRRGIGADSLMTLTLVPRGDSSRVDSVTLRFPDGESVAESSALPPGIYDVRYAGGSTLLAVNVSRELLPRAANVTAGDIGDVPVVGDAPRLRGMPWIYALALGLLCVEWIVRRRRGWR
jgi:hypothetical protein